MGWGAVDGGECTHLYKVASHGSGGKPSQCTVGEHLREGQRVGPRLWPSEPKTGGEEVVKEGVKPTGTKQENACNKQGEVRGGAGGQGGGLGGWVGVMLVEGPRLLVGDG